MPDVQRSTMGRRRPDALTEVRCCRYTGLVEQSRTSLGGDGASCAQSTSAASLDLPSWSLLTYRCNTP